MNKLNGALVMNEQLKWCFTLVQLQETRTDIVYYARRYIQQKHAACSESHPTQKLTIITWLKWLTDDMNTRKF